MVGWKSYAEEVGHVVYPFILDFGLLCGRSHTKYVGIGQIFICGFGLFP